MSATLIRRTIEGFLAAPTAGCGLLTNERSLQLELAVFFRLQGWRVTFELPLAAARHPGSTLRQKSYLDLLIDIDGHLSGIELKVPMNGQHPETIYSFCADLEFVEAIKRALLVHDGLCLMITRDTAFWNDSGRGSPIHNRFRSTGMSLNGRIEKPTGARDTCVVLENEYVAAGMWREVNPVLMKGGRYLLLDV